MITISWWGLFFVAVMARSHWSYFKFKLSMINATSRLIQILRIESQIFIFLNFTITHSETLTVLNKWKVQSFDGTLAFTFYIMVNYQRFIELINVILVFVIFLFRIALIKESLVKISRIKIWERSSHHNWI